MPTKLHFEALLKYNISEERHLKIFETLASAIKDPIYAKNTLSVCSAFGDSAIKFVYDTSANLLTDEVFLGQLLSDLWKGPVAATDRLLHQLLSTGKPQVELSLPASPMETEDPFSTFLEQQYLAPKLAK